MPFDHCIHIHEVSGIVIEDEGAYVRARSRKATIELEMSPRTLAALVKAANRALDDWYEFSGKVVPFRR